MNAEDGTAFVVTGTVSAGSLALARLPFCPALCCLALPSVLCPDLLCLSCMQPGIGKSTFALMLVHKVGFLQRASQGKAHGV